jgi:hypothetical protein
VHGIWAVREDSLTVDEMRQIIASAEEGKKRLDIFADRRHPEYLEHFRYDFDDTSISALSEFLKMAYYHGILKDIPDVKFHSLDAETSSASLN